MIDLSVHFDFVFIKMCKLNLTKLKQHVCVVLNQTSSEKWLDVKR